MPPLPTRRRLAFACGVIVLLGLGRTVAFEFVERARPARPPADERYAGVRARLPTGRLGFLTDEPHDPVRGDSTRYFQAAYALAPRPLVLSATDADAWIADVADPARVDAWCRERGLARAFTTDGGHLVILREAAR